MSDDNQASREPTTHDVQIHLPGILRILGEALYAKPEVAVRELLQNAHDSTVRRRAEGQAPADYQPIIHVLPFDRLGELWIEDNGSGLTLDEIHEFLATVGRGYTGKLRDELGALNVEAAAELIGQFGLGLLSSFLVADEVVVDTRSAATDERFRWRSDGGGTYTTEPGTRDEVGTTVRLRIKTLRREVLDRRFLHSVIQTYADFLPVPIVLGEGTQPVNAMHAPWHQERPTRQDHQKFLEHRYPELSFLEIIPVGPQQITLPDGRTEQVSVGGVLGVPDTSTVSVREYGQTAIYVRRMLVEENCQDLLPEWARFVTGVVESPLFQPTASRETVRRDATFRAIGDALGQAVLGAMERLAEDDPERFRQLVGVHNDLIKSWAVARPEVLPRVEKLVLFETGQGPLTLNDIRRRTGAALDHTARPDNPLTVYFVSDRIRANQARLVLEGRGIPVVDASHGWEQAFLESWAARHPEINVSQVQSGDQTVFETPQEGESFYADLLRLCDEAGMTARVARFQPQQLPAMLVFSEDEEAVIEAQQLAARIDAVAIKNFLNSFPGIEIKQHPGTLMLNADHPLIQDLARLPGGREDLLRVLRLLYAHASLLEQRTSAKDNLLQLFEESAATLEQFLDRKK